MKNRIVKINDNKRKWDVDKDNFAAKYQQVHHNFYPSFSLFLTLFPSISQNCIANVFLGLNGIKTGV
jgi:hypothetical protein